MNSVAYEVEPSVAGRLGPLTILDATRHPPAVARLDYVFQEWPGDDLVATFPCVIVTERLAQAITRLGLTGARFDQLIVSKDPQFEEFFPDQAASLPEWRWLRPTDQPHGGDFWQDQHGTLIVSARAMDLLREFEIGGAESRQYHGTRATTEIDSPPT